MADRRCGDGPRPEDGRNLGTRLRREARARRPPFSSTLHERVCAAVAAAPPGRLAVARCGRPRVAGAAGGLAAVAAAAALVVGWWRPDAEPRLAAVDAPPVTAVPGIERLPTPGEIGADVMAEVTSLAAAAVGVPSLDDLAAFDPGAFAAADESGR